MADQPLIEQFIQLRYFLGLFFYSLIAVFKEFLFGCKRKLFNEPLFGTTNYYSDLSGCVCLINGAANGSIGRLVISKLAESKCYLIITLYGDPDYVKATKQNLINNELKDIDTSFYRFEYLDMMSFDSIIRLVKKLNNSSQKINFFISNPGVALRDLIITEDGFESQLQVNYLGGTLLLIGLLPLLVKSALLAKQNNEPKSKIIFTNSCVNKFFKFDLDQVDYVTKKFRTNFSTHKMYPNSKMFQLMFNMHYFDKMIKANNFDDLISFINIHPGVIDSGLFDNALIKQKLFAIYRLFAFFMKQPIEGAINITTPILSSDQFFNSTDCLYLEDLKIASIHPDCNREELRDALFKKTLSLLRNYINQFNLPELFNPLTN